MTYIRATLDNNAVEGDATFTSAGLWRLLVGVTQMHLSEEDGWAIEEIPEPVKLPTKRNAIIETTYIEPDDGSEWKDVWILTLGDGNYQDDASFGWWGIYGGDYRDAESMPDYVKNDRVRVVFEGED